MYKREKYNLEFKENISKTFLKTVSAFSNYKENIHHTTIKGKHIEGQILQL